MALPDDAPCPRLCHLIKWPDFDGYGFNLHAEKTKLGQFIGKVDDDSPAMLAGLREGDKIVEVNFVNISNENHRQVVERIKSIPNETRLLVVDESADRWYRDRKLVVKSSQPNVIFYRTPVPRPNAGMLPVPVSPDLAARNRSTNQNIPQVHNHQQSNNHHQQQQQQSTSLAKRSSSIPDDQSIVTENETIKSSDDQPEEDGSMSRTNRSSSIDHQADQLSYNVQQQQQEPTSTSTPPPPQQQSQSFRAASSMSNGANSSSISNVSIISSTKPDSVTDSPISSRSSTNGDSMNTGSTNAIIGTSNDESNGLRSNGKPLDLNLNMTASEMRQLIAQRKKKDAKKANLDLREKYEIIQQM